MFMQVDNVKPFITWLDLKRININVFVVCPVGQYFDGEICTGRPQFFFN